ncbi:hypothetical protein FLONG3_6421 [Fusarium longipes]|uniref:PTS EIIA type-4 domain-containing protein n=1 Tax=Fusarium longipes TaxID=694270 RepID=A0A395SL36_9HYPO|nr:hypothetical protein FLONG3_6421 [Fusarium longipes]
MATIVIIPGSFAPPSLYKPLAQSLAQHGLPFEIVDLPSVGRKEGKEPATMSDDVDEIVSVVEKLLNEDKEVALLAHSYGGVPGTQSLEKLSQKARQSEGRTGGVSKIIYIAGVALPDDYMTLTPACAPFVYSESPAEEALKLAKELPQQSTASYRDQLTYPGYKDVEVHYIVCERDELVLPEYQSGMVELLKGMTSGQVGVHRIQSGHTPNLTHPGSVTKIIKHILEEKR